MRIAYLSSMSGYYGGEICLHSLATGMAGRGHEVSCVVRTRSQLCHHLTAAGLEVKPLPLVDWFEPWSVTRLGRWLRRRRIDILHTHLPRDYFIAAMASLGTQVRNVGSRHQLHPISHSLLKRPFLQRFAAMITVSDAVKRGFVSSSLLAEDRVVTIHNGIDVSAAGEIRRRVGPLRRRAGASADDPVIGFVGRLCPSKGLETLLQATARLVPRWPRLKVFVLGDEDGDRTYRRHLQQLARNLRLDGHLVFFGYVEDAASRSAEFDVQVVCSLAEPFGLVTLEAMAQARPVVATATGGSPEIVRDGVEGFLVRPGDADTLARRLDCLLDSPGLRREMGQHGLRRVRACFSRQTMLDRTEALYRDILGAVDRPAVAAAEA